MINKDKSAYGKFFLFFITKLKLKHLTKAWSITSIYKYPSETLVKSTLSEYEL